MASNWARRENAGMLAAIAVSMAGCAFAAYAAAPADIIAARQDNFKQMGSGMKAIGEQLKSPAPGIEAIKAGAIVIDQAAGKVDGYFPQGSGPESGVKTGALPAIWDKRDEFRSDAARLVTASAALRAAVDTGNLDQVKLQFAAVGTSCKECHDNFRAHAN